jgi:hypothetical protein
MKQPICIFMPQGQQTLIAELRQLAPEIRVLQAEFYTQYDALVASEDPEIIVFTQDATREILVFLEDPERRIIPAKIFSFGVDSVKKDVAGKQHLIPRESYGQFMKFESTSAPDEERCELAEEFARFLAA